MDSQEIKNLKQKLKISYVAISVLVVLSTGFFFYGLINNISAQKEKHFSQIATAKQFACEKASIEVMRKLEKRELELQLALRESQMAAAEKNLQSKRTIAK